MRFLQVHHELAPQQTMNYIMINNQKNLNTYVKSRQRALCSASLHFFNSFDGLCVRLADLRLSFRRTEKPENQSEIDKRPREDDNTIVD